MLPACRDPGFTIVAVLSLAVGIGANTAMFSLADVMLLRPLPVPRPNEIVVVGSRDLASESGSLGISASYPDYQDLRERSRSFSGLTASDVIQPPLATSPEAIPEVHLGMAVSDNYFQTFEIDTAIGRALLPEEFEVPGRNAVVVVSDAFWQQALGADPNVIGREIFLYDRPFTIVGVTGRDFTGTDQYIRPEFYTPIVMWPALAPWSTSDPLEDRDLRVLELRGRLAEGVSLDEARAEVAVIGQALADAYPDTNESQSILVRTEFQDRVESSQGLFETVLMLLLLAAAVLLVSCANVAGLLASRAPSRAAEIGVRMAIGARRSRVVRQLITENVLIAFLGATAGLLVGYAGIQLWRQIRVVASVPVELAFRLDQRALAVSMAAAVASVFFFGLIPAFRTTRQHLAGARALTRGSSRHRQWGRSLLVVGQVAMSLTLVSLSGFIYASFLRRIEAGPGFRTENLLTMELDPTLAGYEAGDAPGVFDELVEGARQLAGIRSTAIASFVPMSSMPTGMTPVIPEGYAFPEGTDSVTIMTSLIGPGYFETMGIPLTGGRAFTVADTADTPRVAVVNQELAEKYWPGQRAVGRRFRIDGSGGDWVEVVGVVPTGLYYAFNETPLTFLYLPYAQNPQTAMTLLMHTQGPDRAMAAPLRRMVVGLDPAFAVGRIRTIEDFYQNGAVATFKVVINAIAAMALAGVVIAAVGLYGLIAYGVGRRTREIGIRMALGATRGTVLRMVLAQGVSLAMVGLGIGLFLTFQVDQVMQAAFPGGSRGERTVWEYALWFLVLLALTGMASYLPARRAARIEPTRALRYE